MLLPYKILIGFTLVVGAYAAHVVVANRAISAAHKQGQNEIMVQWKLAAAASKEAVESLRATSQLKIDIAEKQAAVARAQIVYKDKIIYKEVRVNVPTNLPMLPYGFRLQHDNAATGSGNSKALVDSAGHPNGAPVAPYVVAETITENYASARYDKQRLKELQDVVRNSGCFTIQ